MKIKRIITMLTACTILATSVLTGCGAKDDSPNSSSNQVRILTAVTGGKDEAEMKLFEEALEKATGLDVVIEKPAADYDNVLMQKLQGGEEYDLVYISQQQQEALVEQGALMDITDKVKGSEILTTNISQSEWDGIKVNGKLYSGFNKKEIHRVVNVNEAICEKAGIELSKLEPTLDGYYNMLKKMKESNSDSGFYPLNIALVQMFELQPWFSSVGLKGGINIDENGKKYVPWASDESKVVWEWLQKLYAEGLLDPDCTIDTTKELRNKFQTGKTGVVVDWAAWTGLYNLNAGDQYPKEFKATPLPGTKSDDGEYMLSRGQASLWGVPSNAQNVDGAIKLLEFFATQEGGELLSLGIEGHDYNKEGDKYILTDDGKNHGGDHGAPVPAYDEFKNPIGWNPGFEEAMELLPYASIEKAFEETKKYEEIVAKHGVQIVKGSVSVDDGLKNMREELLTAGVIEQ